MSFAQMIAWRYIREQKRHSVLTICSIAIAVAMVTMLFTIVGCLIHTLRGHIKNTEFPHHAVVLYVTDEQEQEIAAMDGVKAVGRYEIGSLATDAPDCRYGKHSLAARIDKLYAETEQAYVEDPAARQAAFGGKETHPIWIDFEFHLVVYDYASPLKYGAPDPTVILHRIEDTMEHAEVYNNTYLMTADFMTMDSRLTMVMIFALLYVFVCFLALMLRLVIDTAFEISAKERERQFGMLQSVGATPQQIVKIMTHEGMMLSVIGVPLGMLLGIGLAYLVYRTGLSANVVQWKWGSSGAMYDAPFKLNAACMIIAAVTGIAWVFFSAYGTGTRVIKMSPIDAMYGRRKHIMRVHRHRIIGALFGWTGLLAARNVRREPKRFLITVLSLTLAITLISSTSMVVDGMAGASTAYEEMAYDGSFRQKSDLTANVVPENYTPLTYLDDVKKLEESGLFASVTPSLSVTVRLLTGKDDIDASRFGGTCILISYLTEAEYNAYYKDSPPVPYQALLDGKYLMIRYDTPSDPTISEKVSAAISEDQSTLTAAAVRPRRITEEEAYALAEKMYQERMKDPDWAEHYEGEEPETVIRRLLETFYASIHSYRDSTTGEYREDITYFERINEEYSFALAGIVNVENTDYGIPCMLLAAQKTYAERDWICNTYYGTEEPQGNFYTVDCVMAREDPDDVEKARALLESLSKPEEISAYVSDNITPRMQSEKMRQTVKYVCHILMVLFALIAAVSMINIISTGILNRRSELGSMCAVGMTNGQLIRLTITECLQYVLTSGIAAALLTAALVLLTIRMVNAVTLPELIEEYNLTPLRPLPMLLISTGCAFAVAAVTTLLSLRRLTQEPLVDAIRNTE